MRVRRKFRIPKMASLLFAGMLAAGLSIGLTGAAQASTGAAQAPARAAQASARAVTPSQFWNEIIPPLDRAGFDLCVDVPDGSVSAGTALQFFHCHAYASNGAPQRWIFSPFSGAGGEESYQIRNDANTKLCIGSPNDFLASGTRLVQKDCDQATAWQVHTQVANSNSPFIELRNVGGNMCMAAANISGANHTPLVVTPCRDFTDAAQIFNLG